MAKVIFHEHTSYESTSDEWKEYVHQYSYFLDRLTGKITRRTVTEFQDTRSGSNTITSDKTVEIARTKLDKVAASKLAAIYPPSS
jgi:hypothetical protein